MGVLNDYLVYLPKIYDSSMAVEVMKKSNVPFDEADLARIVLNLVPVTWGNLHNRAHSSLPMSQQALLLDLEACHKQEAPGKSQGKGKGSNICFHKRQGSSKKSSASGNSGEQVPKNVRPAKFCQRCKSKGSPHLTHNNNKCCKYDKDNNPLAMSASKPSEAKKPFKRGATSRWPI
jgi:hypothetical protein